MMRTSGFGTNAKCRQTVTMSVHWAGPKVYRPTVRTTRTDPSEAFKRWSALDRALCLDDHMRRQSRGATMDVVVWLRSLGLGKYEAAFRENEIDETVLPSLTHETLKELGVTAE